MGNEFESLEDRNALLFKNLPEHATSGKPSSGPRLRFQKLQKECLCPVTSRAYDHEKRFSPQPLEIVISNSGVCAWNSKTSNDI